MVIAIAPGEEKVAEMPADLTGPSGIDHRLEARPPSPSAKRYRPGSHQPAALGQVGHLAPERDREATRQTKPAGHGMLVRSLMNEQASAGRRDMPAREPDAEPPVSIIVLTYNEVAYTRACLESLRRSTALPYELIVVDNGSTDGTPAYLRTVAGAKLVLNERNRGFAGGCNQGLALARGRYLLLLNNDTLLPAGWLERLLAGLADGHQSDRGSTVAPADLERPGRGLIGIAGPRSNTAAGAQLVKEVGYAVEAPPPFDPLGAAGWVAGQGEALPGGIDSPHHPVSSHRPAEQQGEALPGGIDSLDAYARAFARQRRGRRFTVEGIIGFCMLIRREVVSLIGGFDERFGIGNFEDYDYCLRARLAGFRIVVVDDCFVHHYGSRSFAGNRIDYASLMDRNYALFRQKWGLPDGPAEARTIRLGNLLARPFDPARDYVPLPPPPACEVVPGRVEPPPAAAASEEQPALAHPLLAEGVRLLAAGDVPAARERLSRAVALLPRSVEARYFLGCAELQAGEPAAAVRTLRAAAALDPASPDVHTALGAALAEAGEPAAAEQALFRALELDPRAAEAWYQLGELCRRTGRAAPAREALRQALHLDPQHEAARTALETLASAP